MNSLVIGLSGGVDSAVAAALLLKRGCRVEGLTLRIPGAPVDDAAGIVASTLGIPHTYVDVADDFERYVLGPFRRLYASGQTPNPCILCNPAVKFAALARYADKRGLEGVATGHYARTDGGLLLCGADPARDQSYMLYRLQPEIVARAVFPLGDMDKADVRAIAEQLKLPSPPDSQDLCFAQGGSYSQFLGLPAQPGDLVDIAGNVLGRHEGVHLFTVGQRCGVRGMRLYVGKIEADVGRVTLVEDNYLYKNDIIIRDVNWLTPARECNCTVRTRHTPRLSAARAVPMADGRVKIVFVSPHRAPAPGQSAVMYDGNVVLGGGYIE